MWKRIRTGIILAVIVGVLAYFLPLPCWVNTTLTGVLWTNGNASYSEPATITIKGTYIRYLLQNKKEFYGEITFTGLDTDNYLLVSDFKSSSHNNILPLEYYSRRKNQIEGLGEIRVKGAFRKVVLSLHKKDENGNGLDELSNNYISAPATDRRSAVDTAKALYGEPWVSSKYFVDN